MYLYKNYYFNIFTKQNYFKKTTPTAIQITFTTKNNFVQERDDDEIGRWPYARITCELYCMQHKKAKK